MKKYDRRPRRQAQRPPQHALEGLPLLSPVGFFGLPDVVGDTIGGVLYDQDVGVGRIDLSECPLEGKGGRGKGERGEGERSYQTPRVTP